MSKTGQPKCKPGPRGEKRYKRWGGSSPRESRALLSVSTSVARRFTDAFKREDRRSAVDFAISMLLDLRSPHSPLPSRNFVKSIFTDLRVGDYYLALCQLAYYAKSDKGFTRFLTCGCGIFRRAKLPISIPQDIRARNFFQAFRRSPALLATSANCFARKISARGIFFQKTPLMAKKSSANFGGGIIAGECGASVRRPPPLPRYFSPREKRTANREVRTIN